MNDHEASAKRKFEGYFPQIITINTTYIVPMYTMMFCIVIQLNKCLVYVRKCTTLGTHRYIHFLSYCVCDWDLMYW
jgi:hypothetical protein